MPAFPGRSLQRRPAGAADCGQAPPARQSDVLALADAAADAARALGVARPQIRTHSRRWPDLWVAVSPSGSVVHATSGLLERLPPGQLRAAVAHEVAHAALAGREREIRLARAGTAAALALAAAGLMMLGLAAAGLAASAALAVHLLLSGPALSRRLEHEADRLAAGACGCAAELAAALAALNAGRREPGRWRALLEHHPPAAGRVRRLQAAGRARRYVRP